MGDTLRGVIDTVLPYLQAAPDYGRAAWETVQYFYEPKTAAIAGGIVFLLLLLRIFLGGILGWLLRTAIYAGLFYEISIRDEYRVVFPDDPVSAYVVLAIIFVSVWWEVTIVGWLLRKILRRGGGGTVSTGGTAAPAEGTPREAFDVKRNDKEQKQQIVIMMTDIKGYSARMEKDEKATWELLKEHNIIMRKAITTHRGKEIKTIGDAFMVTFQNPLDAVRCGIAMQKGLHEFNKPRPTHDHLLVRIGIHRGEVIVTGKDVFGEGVNIAARLESITDPGGISISADVYQHVKNKVEAGFQSVGTPPMKNIANPPEVFKLQMSHK